MSGTIDTGLDFSLSGSAELSERCEKTPHGSWTSKPLVICEKDDVSLSVGYDGAEDNLIRIRLNAYHIINSETDRAFHLSVAADLDRPCAAALHRYLGFLLDVWQ